MKKIRFIVFTIFVSFLGVVLLTSCNGDMEKYEPTVVEPTCTENGYTKYESNSGKTFITDEVPALGHDYIKTEKTELSCTVDQATIYTCHCGYVHKEVEVAAKGHQYESVVTPVTCTTDGFTTHTCTECGDSYVTDEIKAQGHQYESVVTPVTCTTDGFTTHTCSVCGDSYVTDEIKTPGHIDENLDITCDFEGCTKRILPAADSKISLFTAKHMIIVSLSSQYYMEGVVTEVQDAKNGIFVMTDEAGDTVLVRLPKNAAGTAYSSWTDVKVVLGDTIQLYGKPTRNTSSTTSSQYPAKVEGAVLTILKHEHSFSEPTCTEPGLCGCLAEGEPALGHNDSDNNSLCDVCNWNVNLKVAEIVVATDSSANGVLDAGKTSWTWSNNEFDVVIAKGTSTFTLYTTAKAYMQLKKLNTLTVSAKNGESIYSVTIFTSNATQLGNLEKAIGTAYEYTKDADALSVTIVLNSAEEFVLVNNGSSTVYVSKVEVAYELPKTN